MWLSEFLPILVYNVVQVEFSNRIKLRRAAKVKLVLVGMNAPLWKKSSTCRDQIFREGQDLSMSLLDKDPIRGERKQGSGKIF